MKKLTLLLLILSSTTLQAQRITYKSNEISFVSQKLNRKLVKNIPGRWVGADLVHGLYFKENPFFFCRREPSGKVFCHIYLQEAEGRLQRFDKDSDFGQGSVDDFINDNKISKSKRTQKVGIEYLKEGVIVKLKGRLARRLRSRFFPEFEQIEGRFLVYKGEQIHCRHPLGDPEKSECHIGIPYNAPEELNIRKSFDGLN